MALHLFQNLNKRFINGRRRMSGNIVIPATYLQLLFSKEVVSFKLNEIFWAYLWCIYQTLTVSAAFLEVISYLLRFLILRTCLLALTSPDNQRFWGKTQRPLIRRLGLIADGGMNPHVKGDSHPPFKARELGQGQCGEAGNTALPHIGFINFVVRPVTYKFIKLTEYVSLDLLTPFEYIIVGSIL